MQKLGTARLFKFKPYWLFNLTVPFYSISQDLGIDQDDMSLGIDVYNLATFCKTNVNIIRLPSNF